MSLPSYKYMESLKQGLHEIYQRLSVGRNRNHCLFLNWNLEHISIVPHLILTYGMTKSIKIFRF